MNKAILQLWEESERGWGVRPDGCSIHIDKESRDLYVSTIYDGRGGEVPDTYERILGEPIVAFLDDELFHVIESNKSIRLFENEFNNLIKLEEIIIKHD